MKHLKDFLECDFATPANTNGMGNPAFPEGDNPGSEPITPLKKKLKKKLNKHTK